MALAIQRTIMSCLQPTSSIASAGPASASSPAIASTSQPSTSAAPSQNTPGCSVAVLQSSEVRKHCLAIQSENSSESNKHRFRLSIISLLQILLIAVLTSAHLTQIGSLQVNDEKCRRTQPPGRELLVHYT
ncbi:hypothetical protein OS493_021620 [Desmophyllum pertusum]|uniref:Uncharacterized protein n=1 Tax=Desmophyllum pertusum TaxID=174260 RepID=A0A9W9YED6_9CNID|nr:hypothetical protein OS493_021620 [Desmophyllum pertusum]